MCKKSIYILLACGLLSCSKITPGFLSPTLGYTSKEIDCKRGLTYQASEAINFDGSTPPVTFRLLNLRDSLTGQPAPAEFTTLYDVPQFKPGESFNPDTDSTIELLNAKRTTKQMYPYSFDSVSGQLVFNRASANLPVGMYVFDIQATNVHGTKIYPSAGYINVTDPADDDIFSLVYSAASGFSDATGAATGVKAPQITCTKISNDSTLIYLKIVDKNGVPFNPKNGEIILRGDRPSFATYSKFYPVIYNDTAMVCNYALAPFPLATYVDETGYSWGYLQYYRIPSQYVSMDAMPSPNGYSANPVISFQLFLEGTYVVQVKMTDVVHK
ncbi:hypothetical protein A9P82_07160 [Arachidicoccus ginsenosidimutans]|uniref:DUF5007 domain-containing protein n=1 Tax=Arachidicoccus sp. BS20 TaxID=1850526 RepID=UPI0007F0D45D|nr:DUF5007 domain-containing protein [Arachidicoccus sp. BS20]ANI89087.1 hypothetical protein A9P82_07160 [Arachidicoccus sp. BS20]